jgi:hypothetical protein
MYCAGSVLLPATGELEMHGDLSIRQTRQYVGTYQHLDRWLDIGSYKVLASTTVEDDEDDGYCEPQTTTMLVCVETDEPQPSNRILRALDETFTQHDCHHEYDCCGCRSFHARSEHLGAGHYKVTVGSSRNF